ncbi:galanin receptor type 1 isoform X2 [Hydra vulgaris]|uniref:Galanin receptor type 1 isoform X2 n=1 Tax=Hydra vulgaris TaxID=6087 RepID=A0ABM4CSK4_HYDVU
MIAFMVTLLIGITCINNAHLLTREMFNSSSFSNASLHLIDLNTNVSVEETDNSYMSLEKMCELFKIPEENCSCNKENSEMKEICDFYLFNKTTEFRCDSLLYTIKSITNIISSTLGLIGNSFVIWISHTHNNEFRRFHNLVISLAISDFVFAFVQLIITVPETWTCHWVYGLFLCKLLRSVLAASANIAVGFIVLIAVERYIGIVHLFSSTLNNLRFQVMKFLNVFFGILSVVPPLITLKLGKFNTCSEEWNKKSSCVYTWVLFIFYYLLPIVLMSVFYSRLVLYLRKSYLKSNILNDVAKKCRSEKNKKTVTMLIMVLIMFAVLVLPNRIVWIINDMYGLENFKSQKTIRFLKLIFEIFYGFHAAINPIIYSVFDAKYRQKLKALFAFKVNDYVSSPTTATSQLLNQSNLQLNIIDQKII